MRYVLHFGPESVEIELEGRFTFQDTHSFHRMLMAIASPDSRSVIHVNVEKLDYIDSTGVHLLMMAHDLAKKNRRPLFFVNPRGQVSERLQEAANYNALRLAA